MTTAVTSSDIATALNTAWQTGTYAKPVTAAGDGFVTDPRTSLFWNLITPDGGGGRKGTYGSIVQVFRLTIRHPSEGAIDYCNQLINALTLASTIAVSKIYAGVAGDGQYEATFKITTHQK